MNLKRRIVSIFGGQNRDPSPTYKAMDIAKYIVSKCSKERQPITNLQLQKILYYLQREFLQYHDRALFSDEIKAWTFGPVVSEVYRYFCGFGSFPIFYLFEESKISTDDLKIIDRIVQEKRAVNVWDLVADTHTKGKSWDLIYRDGIGSGDIIPKGLIFKYG